MIDESRIPQFRPGVKLRFDHVRGVWILLAPEKLFMPDDVAEEILRLIDANRTIGAIIDDLSIRFAAPRNLIARDVAGVLENLARRGALLL